MASAVLAADGVARERAAGTGVWVFIGVASTLFSLFVTAYVMRMAAADATRIALPAQLWLSTGCLVAGSVLMNRAARAHGSPSAQRLLWAGGIAAMAFIGAQLWAWQTLLDAKVGLAANPAASFFYVFTALHGLHVLGGLVAWSFAMQAHAPWRVALCARYWHFLLLLWLALYTALATVTPDFARFICGTASP